jgi:hypothetical protein
VSTGLGRISVLVLPLVGRKMIPDQREFRYCLAFRERDVGSRVGWTEVVGAGADEAVVVVLLDDVGGPAGDAADGEDGGEEVDVDAQRGVGGCGVEVDVGVELFFLFDEEFDPAGHVEPLGAACGFA